MTKACHVMLLNGLTCRLMELWCRLRHREGTDVAAGVGGDDPQPVLKQIETFSQHNRIELVGSAGPHLRMARRRRRRRRPVQSNPS